MSAEKFDRNNPLGLAGRRKPEDTGTIQRIQAILAVVGDGPEGYSDLVEALCVLFSRRGLSRKDLVEITSLAVYSYPSYGDTREFDIAQSANTATEGATNGNRPALAHSA